MKPTHINFTTGAKVTVIDSNSKEVTYKREFAIPSETNIRGEITKEGKLVFIKPYKVFCMTYRTL